VSYFRDPNEGMILHRRADLLLIAIVTVPLILTSTRHDEAPPRHALELSREATRAQVETRLGGKAAPLTEPATRPDAAGAFYRDQRLPPGATELPVSAWYEALQEIRDREARLGGLPGGIQSWTSIGPGNIGGRTRAIVIDPTNPDRIFVAGVAGGIFRSEDGGASFVPVDDLMLNLAVCAMVMDPTDPDVLYAGTGEGYGASLFVSGLGIFKSTDGGETFAQLPATAPSVTQAFRYVNDLVVSPNDPSTIYAGTRHGVFRSTDAGATWDVVLANPFYDATPPTSNGCPLGCLDLVVTRSRTPDRLYAAFGNNQADGLYLSNDGGDTWLGYTVPSYQGRMTVAIAPTDDDRVYLAMSDNGGLSGYGRIAGLFRADDGVTFEPVLDFSHEFSPWLFSYVSIATGCLTGYPIYSQGWYDQVIAVDPVDPDVLYLGGIDHYRSDDGGVTFGLTSYFFQLDEHPDTYLHADQHAIVFHPDYDGVTNTTMYVGNDGGVYRTDNPRAASTDEECGFAEDPGPPPEVHWTSLNNGYAVTQFYHGDVGRTSQRYLAGAQDNGVSTITTDDDPDGWVGIRGGDGGYVAVDHTDSDVLYSTIQFFPTIQKSTDGGASWVDAVTGITDTDGLFITPLEMDPSDAQVLWTGGRRPWRTLDGAAQWTLAGPDLASPRTISAIGIAPSDGNVVYLGYDNGYVARTLDGLSGSPSWSLRSAGLPGGGSWLSDIAVDPAEPDVVYVTYSSTGAGHVYRSLDGGASWQSIDGIAAAGIPDIPVHSITVRPGNSGQLYAGTELGVFASDDQGANWAPANDGLAHTVVEELRWEDAQTLVAFTFGRGVFVAELDPVVGVADGGIVARPLLAVESPVRASGAITVYLDNADHARLAVHDVTGRLVRTLHDGPLAAGDTRFAWDGRSARGASVAPGAYFVVVETGGEVVTRKLVRLP